MKKVFSTLWILIFVLLASCSSKPQETRKTVTITDVEGTKEVFLKPERTALLYPSFGDIWTSCGGTIEIGVEDCITRGYAKEGISIVGNGTGKDINLEALVSSKPDFVILSSDFPNHTELARSLKDYGISYGLFECRSFKEYCDVLKAFSLILDNGEAYQNLCIKQEERIQECINNASVSSYCPKVLLLRATTSSIKALNQTNFVGQMLNDLNAINIADTNKTLTTDLSKEVILKENPDVILVIPMGDEEISFGVAKKELSDPLYQNVDAIKNNKVYYMEKDLFHYKPNTRWGEAYEILSKRIRTK